MNPIKKVAYRTYQTVFKLAIPVLPYRSPQVLKSVREVPALLRQQGAERVLLVTDSFLHKSGMLEPLKSVLAENRIG